MPSPDSSSRVPDPRLGLSGPWPVTRTPIRPPAGPERLRPRSAGATAAAPRWWRIWWPVLTQLAALALIVVTGAAVIDHHTQLAARAAAADAGLGYTVALPAHHNQAAAPVSVQVPRLSIHSSLVDLRTDAHGALQPPANPGQAGWYIGSSHPGDPGPTVLAGHVDSRTGPGVFFHLDHLRPGDSILIGRADRTTLRFVVTRVLRVSKQQFPTKLVYRGTRSPSLRLISCGGAFDHRTGHYLDNIIVLAVPAPITRPAPPPKTAIPAANHPRKR